MASSCWTRAPWNDGPAGFFFEAADGIRGHCVTGVQTCALPILSAANTYSGGTTVIGGLINFNSASNFGSGTITLNGGGLQWASGTSTDISSRLAAFGAGGASSDEHTSELQPHSALVCRVLLDKK